MNSTKHVIVIGGGAIGTLIAYHLNRRGYKVTLADKERIGAGASHGNCGLILPHIMPVNMPGVPGMAAKWMVKKNSPFYISPKTVLQNPTWFLNFQKNCTEKSMLKTLTAQPPLISNALEDFSTLINEEAIQCDWQVKGLLEVFASPSSLLAFEKDAEWDRRFGVTVDQWSTKELLEKEPNLSGSTAGGWYYPNVAHLRSDLLMKEMKRVLAAKGVQIMEQSTFESFELSGRRAKEIILNGERHAADLFVLATGAWTALYRNQLKQTVPIQPGKGYSCTFSGENNPVHIPCVFAEKKVVITPLNNGWRLGGTMEFSGFNTTINRSRIDAIRQGAASFFPHGLSGILEEEWNGWRPMTYDGLPFIDFLPELENVIVAAGHNMAGISMAPGTGRVVADFIENGRPTLNPNPFGFKRLYDRPFLRKRVKAVKPDFRT